MKRIIGTIALVLGAMPVAAQTASCLDSEALRERLAQQFSEERTVVGLTNSGTMIELYVSQQGTWTLLETTASGMSCVKQFGTMFMVLEDAEDEGA